MVQEHIWYTGMWATKIVQYEEEYEDGSILSIVIWMLPEKTIERPHGYKYRLNYCAKDGTTYVRYDNKTGKKDHKHIGAVEVPYKFENLDKLMEDFYSDLQKTRTQK